jgi:hypothetical protein
VEDWFAVNAPGELGLMICDDTQNKSHKSAMQNAFHMLRSRMRSMASSRGKLAHLHDDMYFGDSKWSLGIQMADMCSFLIMRHLDGDSDTAEYYNMLAPRIVDHGIEPK